MEMNTIAQEAKEVMDNEVVKDVVAEGVEKVMEAAAPAVKVIVKADKRLCALFAIAGVGLGLAARPTCHCIKKLVTRHNNKTFTGTPEPVVPEADVVEDDTEA